jgi:hypothetical protein
MRADPNDSKVTRTMIAQGVPARAAEAKTRAWKGGIVVAIFGGLVSLVSFAFPAAAFVVLKETPSVALLLFSGVAFVVGMLMVFIGAHAASGEAMAAAGKDGSMLFGAIAAAARKVRGGT